MQEGSSVLNYRPGLYGIPGPQRDHLNSLIVGAQKTATTSLHADYEAAKQPLPAVGEREMLLDSLGRAIAVLETTSVATCPMSQVPDEHIRAEGEGHTRTEWEDAHRQFFAATNNNPNDKADDPLVVLQGIRCVRTLKPLPWRVPVVQAPMAGGPVTPALVAAVAKAGGLGFLAAGNLAPHLLAEQIHHLEGLSPYAYGINIFCPAPDWDTLRTPDQHAALKSYAQALDDAYGVRLDPTPLPSDDNFNEKLDIALASHAAIVSFTFGIPTQDICDRVHTAGKLLGLNATTPAGIDAALAAGADILTLQSADAGGHRAANLTHENPEEVHSLDELLTHAHTHRGPHVLLLAAGGIATAEKAQAARRAGADAIQAGTRFLTAHEAGTRKTHRQALLTLTDRDTTLTRAFSGRLARSITNHQTTHLGHLAPALYPDVQQLCAPLKATNNPETMSLWAGTGFTHCREQSAADIVAELS